jgi:hypothetical protein
VRNWTRITLAGCLLAALIGCGGKSEKDTPATRTIAAHQVPRLFTGTRPDYIPDPSAYGGLSQSMFDTLRVLKKKHNITRDQFWKHRGGVLANDYLEVWYPPGRTAVDHAMYVFKVVMPAREHWATVFGEPPADAPVFLIPESMEAYSELTGREWWHYSDMKGDTIMMQPIYILVKRGLDRYALPHEYYQWAIGHMTQYTAPRWIEEGLASYFCGEQDILRNQMYEFESRNEDMSPERIEAILAEEKEKSESRIAYYRSYRMIKNLMDEYGAENVTEAVQLLGRGYSLDEAFKERMRVSYDEALQVATDYRLNIQPR